MPNMRAITEHRFGRGKVRPGDTYEATEREAQLLTALGWSERVTRKQRKPRNRSMEAAAPGASADSGEYPTRDLSTEA